MDLWSEEDAVAEVKGAWKILDAPKPIQPPQIKRNVTLINIIFDVWGPWDATLTARYALIATQYWAERKVT